MKRMITAMARNLPWALGLTAALAPRPKTGNTVAGQPPQKNNYPLVDRVNPVARAFWQAGFSKLLALGVAAFKLDEVTLYLPSGWR